MSRRCKLQFPFLQELETRQLSHQFHYFTSHIYLISAFITYPQQYSPVLTITKPIALKLSGSNMQDRSILKKILSDCPSSPLFPSPYLILNACISSPQYKGGYAIESILLHCQKSANYSITRAAHSTLGLAKRFRFNGTASRREEVAEPLKPFKPLRLSSRGR